MKRKRAKTQIISILIREELHELIQEHSIDIAQYLIDHISDKDWETICLSMANTVISTLEDEEEKDS